MIVQPMNWFPENNSLPFVSVNQGFTVHNKLYIYLTDI